MKKLLIIIVTLFVINMPISVFALSNLTVECDDTNIAGNDLSCILKTVIDEEFTFNKIESSINFKDAKVSFELEDGIDGNINNDILTISSDKQIGSLSLGKLKIKFSDNTTGIKNIALSNIKFYSDEKEIARLDNVGDDVTVKSDINTLASLAVEECNGCKLTPVFKSDLTIYTVKTTSDTIKITATANGNATVSGTGLKKINGEKETFEIVVTSEAGNAKKYKIIVKKVEPLSSDNSLVLITLDKGVLTPNFSSDVTSYTAIVNKEEVTIDAISSHPKATINGTGTKKLNYGKNEFNIVVTAEDGTVKNYLIVINRPDTRNENAYLKELTINGEDIGFEKDIVEYSYTVKSNVVDLEIKAIPELETSSVTITGDKNLKVGENEVIIKVTAEDETVKEYKIIVIKEELERKEVFLQSLIIEGYNISFNPSTFDYTVVIKDEVKLNIITIPEEESYNVEVLGNENLKNGSIIKIIVTNENNESNIYKIKVSVLENSEVPTPDNETKEINYIPIIMSIFLVMLIVMNIIEFNKYRKK